MRSKADELQGGIIGFAVNQNQIGPQMTVPKVLPLSNQWMVAILCGEWLIVRNFADEMREMPGEKLSMLAFRFPL